MASNSRPRDEHADDDDDDFGDFGGFEAAEPAADVAASQAQAGTSPWALFGAGNAPGRPDLLCAQNRFPPYLDPSNISGASAEPGNLNVNNAVENGPGEPPADLLGVENQNVLDQARIAENVLDGTLNAAAVGGFHPNQNVTNGRLPDIGLGINENRLFAQAEERNQASAEGGANEPPLELPQDNVGLAGRLGNAAPQEAGSREEHENRLEQPNVDNVAVAEQPEERGEPGVSRATHAALQERLNALMERNRSLEEELMRCQEDLAAQRSRVQEVQDRHAAELNEVRKAGHDALAVVVDQYKEQSRAVVAEQQEAAKRHLVETLAEQMKAFQDMLRMQQEVHERQREEDRQDIDRRVERAVEESRQKQQEQFDAFLLEEQAKQKEAIEKAVEAEKATNEERIQRCIGAEQEKSKAKLEEAKAECSQRLEEERNNHERALVSAREESRRLAQEQMSELVSEERERGRQAEREALEASRLDTRAYLDEQRQADSRTRRRHLASLDIFLESARQQISLLLESDRPEASAPSIPPPPTSAEDSGHKDRGENS